MDPSFRSFVLEFSAGVLSFGIASIALAAVFVQARFESSRLFGPSVGVVAASLFTGFLVIVASYGGVPWGLAGVPAGLAVAFSIVGVSLARRMPALAGYGRIDLWLLALCLAGALVLAGLLLVLHARALP